MTKEITVTAIPESLEDVLAFVNTELSALNCTELVINQIDIALDELFGNIVRYAYEGQDGDVTAELEITYDPLSAVITLRDRGIPFDPLKAHEPDVKLKARERKIGGLGIFIVKKTMDEISYKYEDGQNIVRIRKILSNASEN